MTEVHELHALLEPLIEEHSLSLVIAALVAVCDDYRVDDLNNSDAWDRMAKALANVRKDCDL
jgi:hypothetical protein